MDEQLTKGQERTRTLLSHLINEKHPVALAVEAVREDAIKDAADKAQKKIEEVTDELYKAGKDLQVCAPFPDYNMRKTMSRDAIEKATAKYQLFSKLTRTHESSHRPGDPRFASMSDPACDKFIKEAKKDAAIAYDAFVVKLCEKTGKVKTAKLDGNHVWSYSFLTVTKADKTTEVWKTQQIVNISKLGRYFYQWPTRKQKGAR